MNRTLSIIGILVFVVLAVVVFGRRSAQLPNKTQQTNTQPTMLTSQTTPVARPVTELQGKQATINVSTGAVVIEFFPEDAPLTVSNFISLAEKKFYDGLTFHRVEPGFVVQGGDPKGDGTGGPGYEFKDEPVTKAYQRGIVAMANAGPNTNGSQFFVMLADTDLPKQYTIFGKVIKGMELIDQVKVGDTMTSVTIE